jgi:hypothetical protein
MAEGNASPVGEDRNAWLRRWERQNQPLWKALTPEEYEAISAHVRGNNFPETALPFCADGFNASLFALCEYFKLFFFGKTH